MSKPKIVLGTGNRKKADELIDLFQPLEFEFATLAEFPNAIEVFEDGHTFAENAAKKAGEQAKNLGHWVMAEDSGISVEFLKGAPGIYSARFSGENADDDSNNRLLLSKLDGVQLEKRTAHYTCHIALSDPTGTIRATSEAKCCGRIVFQPLGSNGFGYDPLFEVIEYHKTFGVLDPRIKQWISHRSRAARAFVPKLYELLNSWR